MTKGRPRHQNADRYPGGQIRPEDVSLVARLANARMQVLKDLGNEHLSTWLGRFFIQGKIVETQKLAGDRWAQLTANFHRVAMDGLAGGPAMGSLEKRSRGSGSREYEDSLVKGIADRFNKIRDSILFLKNGKAILKALDDLCIEDKMLSYSDLVLCKKGLDRIVVIMDLTGTTTRARKNHNG